MYPRGRYGGNFGRENAPGQWEVGHGTGGRRHLCRHEQTGEIGRRHSLPRCSWGHAGDGNVHSTFLVDPQSAEELSRARRASEELFALAVELGGSISGEHGLGSVKSGHLRRQWRPRAVELHGELKRAFAPKGLFNPGKKLA